MKCIPVGCVPSAAVAILRGVSAYGGCLPRECVYPEGVSCWGLSARWVSAGGCLLGWCLPRKGVCRGGCLGGCLGVCVCPWGCLCRWVYIPRTQRQTLPLLWTEFLTRLWKHYLSATTVVDSKYLSFSKIHRIAILLITLELRRKRNLSHSEFTDYPIGNKVRQAWWLTHTGMVSYQL